MKMTFLAGCFNHHMAPLSIEFSRILGEKFRFVSTRCLEEERSQLGYVALDKKVNFSICAYKEEEKEKAVSVCEQSDVIIFGDAPIEFIKKNLKEKKMVFRYSERIFKKKCPWYEIPLRAIKYFWQYGRHKNMYLLCASAFTAGDYAKTGTFLNKAYKWGYFTETRKYNIDELFEKKENEIPVILWVGRFLDLKHLEHAICVAEKLKCSGYKFKLDIIGTGELVTYIESMIKEKQLDDCVELLGAMPPEEVRNHMERANIYLFTSDRNEGWGAVLNESMNSGCAVVASHEIGAVPYLIKNGENGLVYKSGDVDMLFDKVKYLLDNPCEQKRLGTQAYNTIIEEWNPETAAKRFIKLAAQIKNKGTCDLFETGPCSKAEHISENWDW